MSLATNISSVQYLSMFSQPKKVNVQGDGEACGDAAASAEASATAYAAIVANAIAAQTRGDPKDEDYKAYAEAAASSMAVGTAEVSCLISQYCF